MATLTCPICENNLGRGEHLSIGLDDVGTLIVRHLVHGDVPARGTIPDLDWHQLCRDSPVQYGTNHYRSICGRAGAFDLQIDGIAYGTTA